MGDDLEKAVERLASVEQPYDRRLTYRRVREDDLRTILSALHQQGDALEVAMTCLASRIPGGVLNGDHAASVVRKALSATLAPDSASGSQCGGE